MAAEPGTRLAGRYRLQERISELHGSALWRAVDEPLARPVAVRTFGSGFRNVGRVVAAARAAGRVGDSRLALIFDADENPPNPYLVGEWVGGERLTDMLTRGPLEPERAASFISEVADALATAHRAGVGHGRLTPSSVVWAKGSAVKITGLAIEAALDSPSSANGSPITDAQALGALLYAALTGSWPEKAEVGLPPAPRSDDDFPLPVGQLRAEVPSALEDVVTRARDEPRGSTVDPLETPEAVRDALAGAPRTASARSPATVPTTAGAGSAGNGPGPPASAPSSTGPADPAPQAPSSPSGTSAPARGEKSWPIRGLLSSVAAVLVLTAAGLGAWGVTRTLDPAPAGQPGAMQQPGPATPSADATGTAGALTVDGIEDYDPFADRTANPEEVNRAVDGNPQTSWSTQTYTSAQFGNLKPGLGLMLDMGRPVSPAQVRVTLGGGGTSLELYAGSRSEKSAMTRVASASGTSSPVTLDPRQSVRARYFLVWITKLPAGSGGYQAKVAEIAVRGGT